MRLYLILPVSHLSLQTHRAESEKEVKQEGLNVEITGRGLSF